MSTSDETIVPRIAVDPFQGARMFALVCEECDDDGTGRDGHGPDCPGRIALGIDDGHGHTTAMADYGDKPVYSRHDDAEHAEAFYDLVWPVQLVWAGSKP